MTCVINSSIHSKEFCVISFEKVSINIALIAKHIHFARSSFFDEVVHNIRKLLTYNVL
jgi:hypothetical protein